MIFKSIKWNGTNSLEVYNFLENKCAECGMDIKASGENFYIKFDNGVGNVGSLYVKTKSGDVKCNIGNYIVKTEDEFLIMDSRTYQYFRESQIRNEYLKLISDIGFDYDGMSSVEGLKSVIDDLVKLANQGINLDDKSCLYSAGDKEFNILREEIYKK